MKPCFIVPIANIENIAAEQSDIHLVLAHMIKKSPEYTKAYQTISSIKHHYLIMDNSAFELGYSLDMHTLLEAAITIQADEIVFPEVYKDHEATVDKVKNTLNFLKDHGRENVYTKAAVLQANTFDGYLKCAKDFFDLGIDVIHIPLIDPEDSPFKHVRSYTQRIMLNRIHLVENLRVYFKSMQIKTPIVHLLGLTNPFELEVQRKHSFIRSCDSSSAFIHGYFGHNINEMGLSVEKIKDKMDFENWGIKSDTHKWWRIHRNIDQIKAFCNDN